MEFKPHPSGCISEHPENPRKPHIKMCGELRGFLDAGCNTDATVNRDIICTYLNWLHLKNQSRLHWRGKMGRGEDILSNPAQRQLSF
jgi:hypothetical protein